MRYLNVVKEALTAAYGAVALGGEDMILPAGHQIDLTTRADLAAGEAMLDVFRKQGIGITYSEESGMVTLNKGQLYHDSAVFDDIDGTYNRTQGKGILPHGSIAGIFYQPDPKFNECNASGFLEFNSGNLYYAEMHKGAYLIKGWAKAQKPELCKTVRIKTSGRKEIAGETIISIVPDFYMLGDLGKSFASYGDRACIFDFHATAAHLALLTTGAIDVFITADNCVVPAKRKTAEELGPGYTLVREAGGAMLDWSGNDIGEMKIGMGEKATFDVIAAATNELGHVFIDDMRNNPEIDRYIRRKAKC